MKPTSLFQLGGAAILGAAVLYAIGNLSDLLTGRPDGSTMVEVWTAIVGDTLLLLGLGALYARQSHRAGIVGLVGYVLLVVGIMYYMGNYAVTLGSFAGVISIEQIAQVPVYALANSIMPWLWFAGLVVFGGSIYRAGVLPKYAGAGLVLLAIAQQLTGVLPWVMPIMAVLSFVAIAWLGWALLTHKSAVAREPIPAM